MNEESDAKPVPTKGSTESLVVTNEASTPPAPTRARQTSLRFALAGRLLKPWVRIKREPAEPASLLLDATAVCYVLERAGFSDALILERACHEAGLPDPTQALDGLLRKRMAMFPLSRHEGWLFGRTRKRAAADTLSQLLNALEAQPER
ncbi:MAG: glycerol-3-phosphate 1-O-acyltransferase, partial [Xanthomonadales bacterium]|nr:glycerol-3-phosphate 1-O-acyltransferase [Xanthomonadales bacterium]